MSDKKDLKTYIEELNSKTFNKFIIISIGIIVAIFVISWVLWSIFKDILVNRLLYSFDSLWQFMPILIIAFILLIITFLTFMVMINTKLTNFIEITLWKMEDKNKNDIV